MHPQPKAEPQPKGSMLPQKVREIEITNWKAHRMKTLQGFFSVTLPSGMTIHNLSLHEKDADRWINPPTRSFEGSDGQTHYTDIIEFTPVAKQRFKTEVLAALDRYFEAEGR